MTVVGARPQFIKAAVVSHELEKGNDVVEEIVHTGQHYDTNMSQTFFDELNIPKPVANLGISGGTHGQMTARMLEALESQMLEREPDVVLVYGDTNSTLAAALSAAKLHIPLVHVEAGARTHSATNPEEINRICTDHVSTRLLACTMGSMENLEKEGLSSRASFSGDPMFDAFLHNAANARPPQLVSIFDGSKEPLPPRFYYATCHREENTGSSEVLLGLLDAFSALDSPVIYPVHPRNQSAVRQLVEDSAGFPNVIFTEPVGYQESIYLVGHAQQVITDSGGLQREAFFAGVKCTTVLDFEVWPETMVDGRNILAAPTKDSILAAMSIPQVIDDTYHPFGSGNAAQRIAQCTISLAKG